MMPNPRILFGLRNLTGVILFSTMALVIPQNVGAAQILFFGENIASNGALEGDPVIQRDAFLSNLIGVGTEDFESLNAGDRLPLALSFPGSTGAITATLTDTGEAVIFDTPGVNTAGRFATSGVKYLNNAAPGFILDFSQPIAAFGFYGTDIGDFRGRVTVTTRTENGAEQEFVIPSPLDAPNNALHFWGIIDTDNPFTRVTFDIIQIPSDPPLPSDRLIDFFGIDDLTIGDIGQVVVPIPAAFPLFGAGLGFMGFLGWRRKK